jgi:hypothetical protein
MTTTTWTNKENGHVYESAEAVLADWEIVTNNGLRPEAWDGDDLGLSPDEIDIFKNLA